MREVKINDEVGSDLNMEIERLNKELASKQEIDNDNVETTINEVRTIVYHSVTEEQELNLEDDAGNFDADKLIKLLESQDTTLTNDFNFLTENQIPLYYSIPKNNGLFTFSDYDHHILHFKIMVSYVEIDQPEKVKVRRKGRY